MGKTVLEEVAKNLKLVKLVIAYRYWPSWLSFDKIYRRSKALQRVQWPLTGRHLSAAMTVSHQISPEAQYQTTKGDTEMLTYHYSKLNRKILMTVTIIMKTRKDPKISDFENVALFLIMFRSQEPCRNLRWRALQQ